MLSRDDGGQPVEIALDQIAQAEQNAGSDMGRSSGPVLAS